MAYGAQIGAAPSAPMPTGLNPRLMLVAETQEQCLKLLYELRAKLGVADTPTADQMKPSAESTAPNAASTVMHLLAQSGRLRALLESALGEVA
mgnify:CR=1 FL=1